MTDYNRPASACVEPTDRVGAVRRAPLTTTGQVIGGMDVAALVAAAIMTLGPLRMAAFWVNYR